MRWIVEMIENDPDRGEIVKNLDMEAMCHVRRVNVLTSRSDQNMVLETIGREPRTDMMPCPLQVPL